ncbi:unnamed protein product [Gadus morhua 'NCC']
MSPLLGEAQMVGWFNLAGWHGPPQPHRGPWERPRLPLPVGRSFAGLNECVICHAAYQRVFREADDQETGPGASHTTAI